MPKRRKIAATTRISKVIIVDVGGATANMYGIDCPRKQSQGACPDKRCLYPQVCSSLKADHQRQIRLLKNLRKIPGVKKVFVASGIRYDLLLADKKHGASLYAGASQASYLRPVEDRAGTYVASGVLKLMGKPQSQVACSI